MQQTDRGKGGLCCWRAVDLGHLFATGRFLIRHLLTIIRPLLPFITQVYSGGLDNDVSVWELRKGSVGLKLQGHSNTITGLKVSPDGHHLLTNSMDNTLRVWDMRPFAPANR
jgi:WD40 repeat protein